MKKHLYLVLAFALGVVITLLITSSGVFFQASRFENFVARHYDGEYDEQVMQESVYAGIATGFGDPHTAYIPSEEVDSFSQSLDTSYEGIGIMYNIDEKEGTAQVTEVKSNGPAASSNIKPGDYIKTINGEAVSVENVNSVTEMVKANDTVTLEMYRPSTATTYTETITLAEYTEPSITYTMYHEGEQNIGYIDINSFSNTTDEEFAEALIKLEEQEMSKLIIDVRDNGGGELESVVNICNLIIPNTKPYLTTKTGDTVKSEYTSTLETPKSYEIIGLQNSNSASASEILMGALKYVNGSEIIGQTSYGKGSVQSIYPVNSTGGAVKITVEHWYTGDGSSIDGTGIEPTIKIEDSVAKTVLPVIPIVLEQNLVEGSTSTQALQVNYYLYVNGYDTDYNSNTYNSKTVEAVKAFQADNNLEVTGIVDIVTAEKLYNEALKNCHNFEVDPYMQAALEI